MRVIGTLITDRATVLPRSIHRGSTLITRRWRHITWRWRRRKYANTITSLIAAKQTVTPLVSHVSFVWIHTTEKCRTSFPQICFKRKSLSSTGSILSNTDLSDLSTVGICDIFVYQVRQRVMWFARLADSILFIKLVIMCHWNGFNENAMRRMFQKCFSANNMISLWLNTVIPIIVMIWLPNMTRYLQWRIIYRHLTLVTF